MKKNTFILAFVLSFTIVFSQNTSSNVENIQTDSLKTKDMFQLVDGTWITKKQLDSICKIAWDNSFGKMTEEEHELLFGGSSISIETGPIKKEDE
jgi:hypothetical protein